MFHVRTVAKPLFQILFGIQAVSETRFPAFMNGLRGQVGGLTREGFKGNTARGGDLWQEIEEQKKRGQAPQPMPF